MEHLKQLAKSLRELSAEEIEILKHNGINIQTETVTRTTGDCPKGYFKKADTGECIPDLG